ncbi:MAG: DUF507 family protein [Herpetosiphon sp.]
MKLSPNRVERLSVAIVDMLAERDDVRLEAPDARLIHGVRDIMTDELMVEENLEKDVRELLDQFRNDIAVGRLDYSELYRKTKSRLVRERNIIL